MNRKAQSTHVCKHYFQGKKQLKTKMNYYESGSRNLIILIMCDKSLYIILRLKRIKKLVIIVNKHTIHCFNIQQSF